MSSRVKYFESSFRDPSGRIFCEEGVLYRQVNHSYKENYDLLINCGLFKKLVAEGWLIPHEEINAPQGSHPSEVYKIIQPERIPFISYPYEWCFSQLKGAALLTLAIQKKALEFGMSLKDASAYNIQFKNNRPIFIDTLSFEKLVGGRPWVAYRQFCQHFLAPLALMAYTDVRLNKLLQTYIDGIPLDLASSLLPVRSYFRTSLLFHIHLHAKSQCLFAKRTTNMASIKISRNSLLALMDHLESAIKGLRWKENKSEWSHYYQESNYSPAALEHKRTVVSEFLDQAGPKTVWDLGANTGLLSAIASEKGAFTVAFDNDPVAVENTYRECVKTGRHTVLPLCLDLNNPSPAIGWENRERASWIERGPVDAVLALALIHHLAISNNVPFDKIAHFLDGICSWLIIEFIPKEDSQVQRLLSTRKDIFGNYTQQRFEQSFSQFFLVQKKVEVKESKRTIYLMKKKS